MKNLTAFVFRNYRISVLLNFLFYFAANLSFVQRLKLYRNLDVHSGCVGILFVTGFICMLYLEPPWPSQFGRQCSAMTQESLTNAVAVSPVHVGALSGCLWEGLQQPGDGCGFPREHCLVSHHNADGCYMTKILSSMIYITNQIQ